MIFSLHPSAEKQCQALYMQLPQAYPGWMCPPATALPPSTSPHPFICILALDVGLIFLITPALVLAALAQNFSPLWTSERKSKLHSLALQSSYDQPPTPPLHPLNVRSWLVLVSSKALTFPPPTSAQIPPSTGKGCFLHSNTLEKMLSRCEKNK